MIICSCNVFSDHDVRTAVVVGAPPLTTGELFRYFGCRARCGRCAWSIKAIMHEHAVAEYEPTPGIRASGIRELWISCGVPPQSKMRHKLSGNNQGHLKGKSSCG
jgi:bacterioferritin-associated ferredoxin